MPKLLELATVEQITPIGTDSVEQKTVMGITESLNGVIQVHPHKEYIDNKTTQADEFSEIILRAVPNDKRFAVTSHLRDLVAQVRHQGTSFTAIEQALTSVGWGEVNNPQGLVISKLKDLLAREPDWGSHNRPTWCGNCDELKRTTEHRIEIPRSGGATTNQCSECNPFMMKYKNN
jgi:hypothetical protein